MSKNEYTDSQFELPERFTDCFVRPDFESDADFDNIRKSIAIYFQKYIFDLYKKKNADLHILCDNKSGYVAEHLIDYLLNELLPSMGTVLDKKNLIEITFICLAITVELYTYYGENTDTFGDMGKIFFKDGVIYLQINERK